MNPIQIFGGIGFEDRSLKNFIHNVEEDEEEGNGDFLFLK